MLVANDKSWVLCCPPKCGTTGIQTLAKKTKFCQYHPHFHAPVSTDCSNKEWDLINSCKRRYILVRDPLKRMISLFWYVNNLPSNREALKKWISGNVLEKKHKWQEECNTDPVNSFDLFCRYVEDNQYRTFERPMVRSLHTYIQMYNPDEVITMEEDLIPFIKSFGNEIFERYNKVGKNKGKGFHFDHKLSEESLIFIKQEYTSIRNVCNQSGKKDIYDADCL